VGIPTTCACPEFSYAPDRPAASVEKLIAARASFIGKTNMDQFATGLVGTRSPYGTPRNRFNAEYLPGGSSSGSAVAVAAGLVSFTLGTDTGGSGRVPASYTNTVGLKPMPGKVSPRGLVNPCRSINCITVYALTGVDAMEVLDVIAGYEPDTPFSRPVATVGRLYSKADIAVDPLGPNFNHGHYTNFANSLDLTAVAAPAGFIRDNMPAGVTLLAPPHGEAFLTSLADIFSRMRVDRRGAV
jgi:Asp-tRNA(Asn)/Glu-tRNA(Gln) amidotransferase A subunit family amidase